MTTKSQTHDDPADLPRVEPLRKHKVDGSLYIRPPEVEAEIADLSRLTKEQFVERIKVEDSDDKIRSECLLYFVRRPPFDADEEVLVALLTAIRQRVLKAVPVHKQRIRGNSQKIAECSRDLAIREEVLDKFQEMLCRDREEYRERLDFFECRFNAGISRLRSTARRDIGNDADHFTQLVDDNEASKLAQKGEEALVCISDTFDGPATDFLYRSKIHAAINSLPLDERRVIELWLEGIPIDSQEDDTVTMVKLFKCSEKTVRNRRDRAFAKLAELLKEEDA